MKSFIIIFSLVVSGLISGQPLDAQNISKGVTSISFNVEGVCGMCKSRIENSALVKGVKMAEWDKETHILKVVYNPKKISETEVHLAVIESGHDTEKIKASDEAYQKLPACCAFRDGVENH